MSHQFNFQTNTVQSTPVEEVNKDEIFMLLMTKVNKDEEFMILLTKVDKDEEGRYEHRWSNYDFNDKSEQLNDGKNTYEGLISMMTKWQTSYS